MIESSDIFQILENFQNFDVYFINRYLTVWGFTIVTRKSHYQKNVRFYHSFVDSCIGTICRHKDFTGRVVLWENFISPRNNVFHTQKYFFLWQGKDPQMGPICSECYNQSDRQKILEPPWSVLDT